MVENKKKITFNGEIFRETNLFCNTVGFTEFVQERVDFYALVNQNFVKSTMP